MVGDLGLFRPDGDAAARSDLRVADGIRASIATIFGGLIEHDADLPRPDSFLADGPLGSAAVALYFDLLGSVLKDDVAGALAAYGDLARAAKAAPAAGIVAWGDLDADRRDLVARHVNGDPSTRVLLSAPSSASVAAGKAAIGAGLDLFDACAPEIAAEIRATVREIVLVSGSVNEGDGFDGATAFSLWGALLLNADEHATRIEAVDGLSHETAHAVLLGRSLGHPFVENPEGERHASPLRAEARPLDGIFHATFVSARMHYAHSRVLGSGALTEAERAASQARLEECREAFLAGSRTLRSHARLTGLGDAHLSAATLYMERAARPVASPDLSLA